MIACVSDLVFAGGVIFGGFMVGLALCVIDWLEGKP
jgi:hypothetical protein